MNRNRTQTHHQEHGSIRTVHPARVDRIGKLLPSDHEVEKMSGLFKTLGNPTRLRIALALREGEMCVCDLAALLGLSESAVSHQLRRMRDKDLVRNRRDGLLQYYRLDDDHIEILLQVSQVHTREVKA